MELPQEFLTRMKKMLGDEYEAFLQTYGRPRQFGLRVNTLKISVEEFLKLAPFHLRKIPWTDNGFYYEKEDDPARHPFYYAGLYYLQEPSAMLPAQVLPVSPGDRVLDLCAAPGGKATELAAKLQGQGLLVANEISASRAKALLKNLEVSGVTNSFVTNTTANRLAEQFPEFFDRILVDAPCSGEGMFRKDAANARAWSMDKVHDCAGTQRELVVQAVKMLRPGGLLLYSTCTFAPEEDEGTVAYLLRRCPQMRLLEIPRQPGFSQGKPEYLREVGDAAVSSGADERDRRPDDCPAMDKCVRIFPHRVDGEGHFLALLQKGEPTSPADGQRRPGAEAYRERPTQSRRTEKRRGYGCPSADEEKVLRAFWQDISADYPAEQIEAYNGQAYYVPFSVRLEGSLSYLREGLYLGEVRRGRLEPSQAFAMALHTGQYISKIDFPQDDARIRQYLRGETVDADDLTPARNRGWQLVCTCGYPLGWGKLLDGTLKNKYHPGWRMPV